MKSKLKRMLLAVLCICAISGAAVAIPARAADHVCNSDVVTKTGGAQSKQYVDDMYHKVKYSATYSCSICGGTMGIGDVYELEGHKFQRYESLGHSGKEHTYKITCGSCLYSRNITIPCLYDATGKHTPPF